MEVKIIKMNKETMFGNIYFKCLTQSYFRNSVLYSPKNRKNVRHKDVHVFVLFDVVKNERKPKYSHI